MRARFTPVLALTVLLAAASTTEPPPPPAGPGPKRAHSRSKVPPLAPGTWASRGPGGGGALFSPMISAFDPDEMFLETDMSGVFHTRDFGESWETLDFRQVQGDSIGRVAGTSDRAVLYALSSEGARSLLARSTDGGRTFHELAAGKSVADPRYLFADPERTDTFVCADERRIYLSRDGGASVAPVHACASAAGCVLGGAVFDAGAIYVATSDGVLVAREGRDDFTALARAGIPADERIVSFAGARGPEGLRLYALTYGGGEAALRSGMTSGDPARYAGIYRLDPSADRWARRTDGIGAGAKLGLLAMARVDAGVVYAAGKDARTDSPVVYGTTTAGDSWAETFRTERNANIDTGWAGDGGDLDWDFGEVALGLAVAPTDPQRVIVSDLGFAHVTRDGGHTWQAAYVAPPDRNPRGHRTPVGLAYATAGIEQTSVWTLAFPAPNVLFAAFTDIRSARSVDGGESWRRSPVDGLRLNTTYAAVTDPASGALYAATSSVHDLYQNPYLQDERIDGGEGAVMVSRDAGDTFALLHDFRHPVVWLALDPAHPARLYASVVHSTEGGIYALELRRSGAIASAPRRLPIPPRTQGHPYTFHVLQDGTILASYSARREPSAHGARGPFTPSSGVFVLSPGASAWDDVSVPAMEHWTKDVVIDPHDPSESTWYAAVFDHTPQSGTGGLYRTRDRGKSWRRISSLPHVESCTAHPRDPSVMYLTTETDGMFVTRDLQDDEPRFRPVEGYPFRQPLRLFFNPRDVHELWATSFGGGLRATLVE